MSGVARVSGLGTRRPKPGRHVREPYKPRLHIKEWGHTELCCISNLPRSPMKPRQTLPSTACNTGTWRVEPKPPKATTNWRLLVPRKTVYGTLQRSTTAAIRNRDTKTESPREERQGNYRSGRLSQSIRDRHLDGLRGIRDCRVCRFLPLSTSR